MLALENLEFFASTASIASAYMLKQKTEKTYKLALMIQIKGQILWIITAIFLFNSISMAVTSGLIIIYSIEGLIGKSLVDATRLVLAKLHLKLKTFIALSSQLCMVLTMRLMIKLGCLIGKSNSVSFFHNAIINKACYVADRPRDFINFSAWLNCKMRQCVLEKQSSRTLTFKYVWNKIKLTNSYLIMMSLISFFAKSSHEKKIGYTLILSKRFNSFNRTILLKLFAMSICR